MRKFCFILLIVASFLIGTIFTKHYIGKNNSSSLFDTCTNETSNTCNLEKWIGQYLYNESFPPNITITYAIDIYNKAGRYQATLDSNKDKTSREVFERLASYGGVVISLEHVKQIWGIKDEWLYTAMDGVRGEVSVLIKGGLKENALEIEVVNKNEIKFK